MTALLVFAGAIYTAVAVGVYLQPDVRPFPDTTEHVAWAVFALLWPVGFALALGGLVAGMIFKVSPWSNKP